MTKRKLIPAGFMGFILLSLGFFSCSKAEQKNQTNDSGKIKITATIGMVADITKAVGGDEAEVQALMGAGVDPHLYRASAGDMEKLQKADIIFYNGLHLEAKMGEVLQKISSTRKTVAVAENIPKENLLPFEESEFDPHVWFDVKLWKYAAEAVYKALTEFAPQKKDIFQKNYEVYIAKLDELDEFIKKRTSEIPQEKRVLVTAHDAFNYFSRAYGFEVRGLQGISTVSEAGAKDVQELADFIAEKKLPAIFVESSVPEKNVKALQKAVKARGYDVSIGGELFSDAMGDDGSFEGTYIGMLTHNINTIIDALKK
ncbi:MULTISPECIES: metal ABC transporter solute-binding protein, Zn/Mn family [unclassified Treponema]|uniref:metal ABC transporter solute-binding protein, Zn/Mn family n=1 Tax=unclassified Treponema TaxID=2638727 RepID=UPI0020A5CB96|nr:MULTISPECIES: zinc ABC transporter substrate-binding protein [unclassified Treponema]UTC65864.1 zinc ABC transporter substrate-binding protein [Treponema sp. OMZ 789]UTC68592.1 zinc ABC transporter substrate-binding protein [Treponema sp. OMZ 790]UTC71322.1 zinc ABC transporter substrate-binding protein [Treponema sp. OMZ 791]